MQRQRPDWIRISFCGGLFVAATCLVCQSTARVSAQDSGERKSGIVQLQNEIEPIADTDNVSTKSAKQGENGKRRVLVEAQVLRGSQKSIEKLTSRVKLQPFVLSGNQAVVPASATRDDEPKVLPDVLVPFQKAVLSQREVADLMVAAVNDRRVNFVKVPNNQQRATDDLKLVLGKKSIFVGFVPGPDKKLRPEKRDTGIFIVAHPVAVTQKQTTLEVTCDQSEIGAMQKMQVTGPDGKPMEVDIPASLDSKRCSTVCDVQQGQAVLLTGMLQKDGDRMESLAVILTIKPQ